MPDHLPTWHPMTIQDWVTVVLLGLVVWAVKRGIPAALEQINKDRAEMLAAFNRTQEAQAQAHLEAARLEREEHRAQVAASRRDFRASEERLARALEAHERESGTRDAAVLQSVTRIETVVCPRVDPSLDPREEDQ